MDNHPASAAKLPSADFFAQKSTGAEIIVLVFGGNEVGNRPFCENI